MQTVTRYEDSPPSMFYKSRCKQINVTEKSRDILTPVRQWKYNKAVLKLAVCPACHLRIWSLHLGW